MDRKLLQQTGELFSEFTRRLSERKVGASPMSILQGLKSEVERRKKIFKNMVMVPARYTVLLSSQDGAEFAPFADCLRKEFIDELDSYIRGHSYSCGDEGVAVVLEEKDSLARGQVEITARFADKGSGQEIAAPPGAVGVTLEIRHQGKAFATLTLAEGEYVLGRGRESDVRLPPDDLLLSKKHCRIFIERGSVWLEDLRSSNGTFLNGEGVLTRRSVKSGDCLQLGSTEVKVSW